MSSIGIDRSGNGNNWTSNNLTQYDVMVDSPTNNFCVLNPLTTDLSAQSEGNLQKIGTDNKANIGTFGVSTGKWYFEVYINTGSYSPYFGLTPESNDSDRGGSYAEAGRAFAGGSDGYYKTYTGSSISGLSSLSSAIGNVWGIAYDCDAGTIKYYINNSLKYTDTTLPTGVEVFPLFLNTTSGNNTWRISNANFGADSSFAGNKTPQVNSDSNGIGDFYYAPPTGFLALCTANLPEVDVIPSENFNPVLYTGNGSNGHAIGAVGFQPDLVWTKERSGVSHNALVDVVRGVSKQIYSNLTVAEEVVSGVTAFGTDGFTLGANNTANENGQTYVAWNWKAGGNAVSNTNGTITSSVSANVDAGFSIATFTLPTSAQTIGHGLSKPPELVIQKGRATGSAWWSFVKPVGNTKALRLDSSSSSVTSQNFWNNTDPTSTVVTIGAGSGSNNSWLMYCFHSVEGYSKVGSYVGNGNVDGVYVNCGFSPAVIITKSTGSGGWRIIDNKRTPFNPSKASLYPDSNDGEYTGSGHETDFTANGFKMRNSNSRLNTNGQKYIFLAFAESPFKNSNAR